MTEFRNPRDAREPAHEDDPVAEFFARERAQVSSEHTNDLDWQRIVRQATSTTHTRRSVRPRTFAAAILASAAAVLIVAFGITTWGQQPFRSGQVQAGTQIKSSTESGLSSQAPVVAPPATSPAQSATGVPSDITTWSMSNASGGVLFALGGSDCAGEVCPVLMRSVDNGQSWRQVHKFTGTDSSSATGSSVDQVQPARAITQVRFVTPQIGYVFGGDLWRTADRGASFTQLEHPGEVVLDVEIWNRQIIMLSADGCVQGRCAGPAYVSRFATDSTSAVGQTVRVPVTGGLIDGDIVVTGDGAYVETVDGNGIHQVRYFDGSHVTAVGSPAVCRGSALSHVELAATTTPPKTVVYALCGERVAGGRRSYTVVRSTDSGATWQVRSVAALDLPNAGQVTLAAGRKDSVVVSAGGPRLTFGQSGDAATGTLLVSQDGGSTFAPVTRAGAARLPAGGFDWVASPGGSEFYAISRTQPGYWHSVDNGRSWTVVDPRQ